MGYESNKMAIWDMNSSEKPLQVVKTSGPVIQLLVEDKTVHLVIGGEKNFPLDILSWTFKVELVATLSPQSSKLHQESSYVL